MHTDKMTTTRILWSLNPFAHSQLIIFAAVLALGLRSGQLLSLLLGPLHGLAGFH